MIIIIIIIIIIITFINTIVITVKITARIIRVFTVRMILFAVFTDLIRMLKFLNMFLYKEKFLTNNFNAANSTFNSCHAVSNGCFH